MMHPPAWVTLKRRYPKHRPPLVEHMERWMEAYRKARGPLPEIELPNEKSERPSPGQAVTHDGQWGFINWIDYDDELITVNIDNELYEFSMSEFEGNYTSRKGRIVWEL